MKTIIRIDLTFPKEPTWVQIRDLIKNKLEHDEIHYTKIKGKKKEKDTRTRSV